MSQEALEDSLEAALDGIDASAMTSADIRALVAQALYEGLADGDAMVELRLTADQALGTSGQTDVVLFPSVNSDYTVRAAAFTYTAGTGQLTVNEDGYYLVNALVSFEQNATGTRTLHVESNESGGFAREFAIEVQASPVANFTQVSASKIVRMTAGNELRLTAMQSSGGSLDLNGASAIPDRTYMQVIKWARR